MFHRYILYQLLASAMMATTAMHDQENTGMTGAKEEVLEVVDFLSYEQIRIALHGLVII